MNKCWARSLGNCSDKISKEHFVTEGLFPTSVVRIKGFSWCRDEAQEIPVATLATKILCTTHNSRLSPVDASAIKAFEVFEESVRLTNVRQQMRERRWRVERMAVDG